MLNKPLPFYNANLASLDLVLSLWLILASGYGC